MTQRTLRWAAISVLCLCPLPPKAEASIPTSTQVGWIVAGIAASGAAIGVGLYFAFNHSHSIRGCAASGANGLELRNEGDQKNFHLLGMTADVKPGDRVRVSGKHKKAPKGSSGNPTFLVEKLAKDYGVCEGASMKPQ
ncbi:MAG: hypothetical protein ACRD3N_00815 [Terracidiphilus sp.]